MPLSEPDNCIADESASNESAKPPVAPYLRTLCALLILLGLQLLAVKLMSLPMNRVIEMRYCKEYYREHDPSKIDPVGRIPEHLCKLDGIQQSLAWLQGAIETLHAVIGKIAPELYIYRQLYL
jgi:hypothetical protein